MSTWTATQELFAAAMPGYEDRAEQTRLATQIETSLNGGEWLMAEAGCGTGKSFAALVPTINWALSNAQTAVVSTATKALQTQYSTKDLPFLADLYAKAGRPFRWAVVKGRGNYLCQAKLDDPEGEIVALDALRQELDANPEHTGDLDDVVAPIDVRNERSKLTSSSEECPGKNECPFGEVCFAEMAKKRAAASHVVVVNHAFLMVDAQGRERSEYGALLPEFNALVVDEAHEVEEYATSSLGNEFTERSMAKLGKEISNFLEEPAAADALGRATTVLFAEILPAILRGKGKREAKSARVSTDMMIEHSEAMIDITDAFRLLSEAMSAFQIHGDDRKVNQRKRLKKRVEKMIERIGYVTTANSNELVRWVERDERAGVVLKYAPLHVGEFLRRSVWSYGEVRDEEGNVVREGTPRSVVLMSATLSTGDADFSYVARAVGMKDYVGFDAGTPFDFSKQAALYIPKPRTEKNPRGFADPTQDKEGWRSQVQAVTTSLVLASGGRALLLYTSKEAMLEAAEMVGDRLEEEGLQVLVQDGKLSNRQLADEFRRDETSVLFAMKSFMTGADFQGRTLQLVIVDKLPFAVPTDVIVQARGEAADKLVAERYGKSVADAKWHREGSFNGMTIPAAILILMQALGRGVRTKTDNALLVVLDPRLVTKNYGPRIVGSLPPAKRLSNINEAKAYLAALDA